ncbi:MULTISPECIES: hypothetical protein [unclassified Brenneria]|uniref:hypothetical protein n=1 Tax=unclassified Brenneria TaxID=2634434 RepID=UPI0029C47843|nr:MULTISPECIES: hypothetical protein [unclassified Brenneria]MDX5630209.1 hypothetical protein [Brenneria sp. L3-3Z]MDX5697354.1 hypothetical protein [Brenneria sp. L4-2C]
MRRNIIILISVAVIGALALTVVWPYIQMEFASSAHYTQMDKREYEYYTPDLLKEMPRISDNYEFSYSNISGPQAFVYGIQFNGTTDTSKIREYLRAEGYEQQKQCQTEAECWRSPRSKDVVSFYSLSKLDLVSVEIYRREHAD